MKKQDGMMLIEVLISMLLFSIALLALVASKGNAIKLAGDAKLRTEASYLATQLVGQMWVDRANLGTYAHKTTSSSYCTFSGTAASAAAVTAWLGDSTKSGTVLGVLPNATAQVLANGTTGAVTITICWRAPQETETHNFTTTTLIPG